MDAPSQNTLTQWQQNLENILQSYAAIPHRYADVKEYVIVSREGNHFLLMQEGWHSKQRLHGPIVHAEIKDGKIWIHYDGIEDGITDALVAAGVPKDRIVLAFHPPYVRSHTGYAIA